MKLSLLEIGERIPTTPGPRLLRGRGGLGQGNGRKPQREGEQDTGHQVHLASSPASAHPLVSGALDLKGW